MNDKQIHFAKKENHDELYNELLKNDWKIQNFLGCVSDWNQYKKQLNKKYKSDEPVENI